MGFRAFYTGVGSRNTPSEVLTIMGSTAYRLAKLEIALRSGKAPGADAAFQLGMQRYCEDYLVDTAIFDKAAEIYIPWDGFASDQNELWDFWDLPLNYIDCMISDQKAARDSLVEEIHPNFEALKKKRGAFALHSRNIHQVLGMNILSPVPSKFCLYYAEEDRKGNPKGGTATAVNLCKKFKIPTLNLNTDQSIEKLEGFLGILEDKYGKENTKPTE